MIFVCLCPVGGNFMFRIQMCRQPVNLGPPQLNAEWLVFSNAEDTVVSLTSFFFTKDIFFTFAFVILCHF
ncbi:hypothetical protein ASG21_04065 [Chryseobacterium sp. Leaf394]|nr:hypothetical protein ASG21_04065 [Chryseobacterium sp. Leaf394]